MRYYKYVLVPICLRLLLLEIITPTVPSVNLRFIDAHKNPFIYAYFQQPIRIGECCLVFFNAFCILRRRLMTIICDLWMPLWVSSIVCIDIKCINCYNEITLSSHKLIFDGRINSQIFYIVPYLKAGQYSFSISCFWGR